MLVISLAAREVSQRGGGARRGSGAPQLMSPEGAKSKRSARSDVLAEACRNRTDPSRLSRDADGFEVREGHQTPCASDFDYVRE